MSMLPQEIIRIKRDGGTLSHDEIGFMVRGITDNSISEGQVAAFAMAVFIRGMSHDEIIVLTREMMLSGNVLDWSSENLDGPILDKHSTGGVGDKVSLILTPIVAACGGYAPLISGRGLGHTGGTLDKLESIPGYNIMPGDQLFRKTVREVRCAIIGPTETLAPADGRLYGIRDVTATVESIPLITASILAKKLAAGSECLVMDVKTGSGAFADTMEMATELAESIVAVANGAGLKTTALITDMDQVMGRNVGNALEVIEAVQCLTGDADKRLCEVVIALSAEMLCLGGLAASPEEGATMAMIALDSGRAAEIFARMVSALGGPENFVEKMDYHLPKAPIVKPCFADTAGQVVSMKTRDVGMVVLALGGGRRQASDSIDYSVGLTHMCQIGQSVGSDQPIAMVHAKSEADADQACAELRAAISIGDEGVLSAENIIHKTIRADN